MRISRTVLLCLILIAVSLSAAPTTAPSSVNADGILAYLDQTIEWYRRVSALAQTPVNSQELVLRETVRSDARQTVHLGFEYARAESKLLPAAPAATTSGSRGRSIAQIAAAVASTVADLQRQLSDTNEQLSTATGSAEATVLARQEKIKAQLNLASVRLSVLQDYSKFFASSDGGDANFAQRIDELESSVPETRTDIEKDAAASAAKASPTETFHIESVGVLGLISEMFDLSGRLSQLTTLSDLADKLYATNQSLREPIRSEIQSAIRRGEQLSTTQPVDDPAKIDAQRSEIDALAAHFKLIGAVSVPLGEQNAILVSARENLLNWHRTLSQQYSTLLRSLLMRLGMLGASIGAVVIFSIVWQRATYRYVHDTRRRRQLMVVRRMVVVVVMIVVVIASFVTEIGSLATFAGLITAGIAVALQTVILSGVAYFFFIGRFGVRVGDRVTISGITGDVVELGLFRLYLMELTGGKFDLRPTGRVVVFSNAVLFQPSAFYKQLPGADYVWHEITFILARDASPHAAEQRLTAVVQGVYNEYRDSIERQHRDVTSSLHISLDVPKPESRLKFIDSGVEFVVRYPVELRRASEIDDKITRKLLEEIDHEPKLKLVPKP